MLAQGCRSYINAASCGSWMGRIPRIRLLASISAPGKDRRRDYEESLEEVESQVLHHVTPNAKSLDSLALWLEKGKLNLYPKYQRKYVWKEDKASRLVVTALCGRIVPAVTMHEVAKGRYDMVDGKQRLSTLLAFYLAGEKPDLFTKLVRDKKVPPL